MQWNTPLVEGRILKRYKRFLADVELAGSQIVAHVPNTGSMTGCWGPNWKCALSVSTNPSRKLPYTLELTFNEESWIGVNTANANKLAQEALAAQAIPELSGYSSLEAEKKIGPSRLDFYLSHHPQLPDCYVEVKSVTLKEKDMALFPDAISSRALKHLHELELLKAQGHRAVMLFVIQREDVHKFAPASDIDTDYAQKLKEVAKKGVEIYAYRCKLSLDGIFINQPLPIII